MLKCTIPSDLLKLELFSSSCAKGTERATVLWHSLSFVDRHRPASSVINDISETTVEIGIKGWIVALRFHLFLFMWCASHKTTWQKKILKLTSIAVIYPLTFL